MTTNWATTPVVQQRTKELEEARKFWEQLVGGQVPLEGLTTQQRKQLIGILGNVASDYPTYDISKAVDTYVKPALYGNSPTALRNAALGYFADRATDTGQWTPELASMFQTAPISTADILARGDILGRTAEQLHRTPEWQQAYSGFKSTLAPGGNVAGAGVPGWAAMAQPYFQLQTINPALARELGEVQFPTDATNLSRYAQTALKGIGEAGLAAQGLYAAPGGTVRETPLDIVRRLLGNLPQLIHEYILPALSAFGGGYNVASGYAPGLMSPTSVGTQGAATNIDTSIIVDNLKTLARTNYSSGEQFRSYLKRNEDGLRQVLDEKAIQELYRFADTNQVWRP